MPHSLSCLVLPPPLPPPPPPAHRRWHEPLATSCTLPCRRQQCDVVAASIYVNPTQFSANEDFGVYPRSEACVHGWGVCDQWRCRCSSREPAMAIVVWQG